MNNNYSIMLQYANLYFNNNECYEYIIYMHSNRDKI